MGPEKDERAAKEPGRLDDRVLRTLEGLRGRLAFSGLRRVLGAHPEALARSLRRLEREGLVERVDGGYRVLSERPRSVDELTAELDPIARVELPAGASAEGVLARLAGRWFGSLRWVGTIERPDGPLLAWAERDGSAYVLLGIERGVLRVYVPGAVGGAEAAATEEAAYELLVHAVGALRPAGATPGARVSFLAAEPTPPTPWPGDN